MRSALTLLLSLSIFASVPTQVFAATKKSQAKLSLNQSVQSHAAPIADDEDDDEADKFERPGQHEEDDGGDPYPRYSEASYQDGNCDPTFLRDLYANWSFSTCHASLGTGSCLNIEDYHGYWGAATGGTKFLFSYVSDTFNLKDRVTDLRLKEMSGKTPLTQKELAELQQLNAKFVGESRKLRASAKAKIFYKSVAKGALATLVFVTGYVYATSDLWPQTKQFLTGTVLKAGACSSEERDPDFLNYVPVETGTCKTPLYQIGHPKVSAFLELPLQDKMRVLQNKLTCGYYKSLNVELIKRNGYEEGRTQIEKVRCDHATGRINFELKKVGKAIDNNSFSISRKNGSQEFSAYTFERTIADEVQEAASFDLAKKEDDIQLVKTRILNRPEKNYTTVLTEKIPDYQANYPARARTIFGAFRTVRKYSRNLAMCCDLDPPVAPTALEKSNPKKHLNVKKRLKQVAAYEKLCPKEWFQESPRTNIAPPTSAPKAVR